MHTCIDKHYCQKLIGSIAAWIFGNSFEGPFLSEIQVEMEDVHKNLLGLNPVKSTGPDNIHPRVPTEVADYLVASLINIFHHSFEIGALPLDWRSAHVVPIKII